LLFSDQPRSIASPRIAPALERAMPELLIAALVLWGLVMALRWFARADPALLARAVKRGGGSALLLLAALLALRGSVEAAAGLGGLGLWLLGWIGAPWLPRSLRWPPGGWRPQVGSASRMQTAMLAIEVDPASGAIRGCVLVGPFAGRELASLDQTQCFDLWSRSRNQDPPTARVLEAYFDRRFPGWRAAGQGDGDARRQNGRSAMSEQYAYEMLGLAKGASPEEITRAHRTLMKKVHPDHGGSASLAALLNEARDVLMREHKRTPEY